MSFFIYSYDVLLRILISFLLKPHFVCSIKHFFSQLLVLLMKFTTSFMIFLTYLAVLGLDVLFAWGLSPKLGWRNVMCYWMRSAGWHHSQRALPCLSSLTAHTLFSNPEQMPQLPALWQNGGESLWSRRKGTSPSSIHVLWA